MAKMLLSAMPFTGHVAPLLAIAAALAGRGHEVRVYTGAAFRPAVEDVGARWIGWRRAPDFDENDLPATFPRLVGRKGIAQVMVNMRDLFIATGPAQVADLEAEWEREPWDVFAADEASIAPRLFAEKSGCAWAAVAVLPLNLPSGQGPPSGIGLAPGANPVTRARDAALRALVPVFAGPLRRPTERARAAVGLPPSREVYSEAVFAARIILASGVPALDYRRSDRPDRLHWVGQLQGGAPQHPSLPSWWSELDGRRVVLVSQGTQNIDPEDLIRPALSALEDVDAIVVATTGIRGRDGFGFAVPANARVAGFVPFDLLLPRVDVAITNGGWGGTLAVLAHGIPLVVAGGDLDKPEVAARVANSGGGVDLGTGRPSQRAIRAGFDRVAADPAYRDAAHGIADDLRAAGGAARAAELLEQLAPV